MPAPDAPEPLDAELVRKAAEGDRDAFAAIYRRYHGVVYRFALMMSNSRTMAEDVTQETFVALIRNVHRYDPHRAGLATYLYGMARNLARVRLRRDRRFVQLEEAEGAAHTSSDPSTRLAGAQDRDRVRRAIAQLPSRYREVVILCAIHGLTYAEVAAVLGTPVGTVRSRLNRGKQAMAKRLLETDSRGGALTDRAARCEA